MFRKLPTLKFDAYNHAAGELCFLASDHAAFVLRVVGSNHHVLEKTLLPAIRAVAHASEALEELVKRGYILAEPGWEDRGCDGMRPTTKFRVNWKQIRQLNKAISLL